MARKEAFEEVVHARLDVVITSMLNRLTNAIDPDDIDRWRHILINHADALRDALEPFDSGVRPAEQEGRW